MDKKEIEKFREVRIEGTTIYDGKILKLVKDKVLCPSGNISTREVIRDCLAVTILPIVGNKILFERQYRYCYDEVIWELPAGKVDKNEDITTAAIRELEEETGYKAENIEYLGEIYPSCGYTDEHIHLFLCEKLLNGKRHLDENEIIDLYYFTLEEVIEMIKRNEIKDAKTVAALTHYIIRKGLKL